jgi:energy-coupling factor transporter ATP-binding protein EcfA2
LDFSDGAGNPSPWTILLGHNGTGKTTILQSLVGFEDLPHGESLAARFFLEKGFNAPMIRTEPEHARLAVKYSWGYPLKSRHHPISTIRQTFEFRADGRGYELPLQHHGDTPRCYAYGASRRLSQSGIGSEHRPDSTATLFDDDAPLLNPEEWLLRLDYSASKASDIQGWQRERLQQVRQLLIDVLPDVEDIRFTAPTSRRPTPAVEFRVPYGWVPLGSLGHGYRTLISWMVDFASRLVDRYPDSPNPLAEPAVCLVDEIDLHLHPAWQRKLISHLTALFPNTQFIATAHSPLIVQAAGEDANIAVLRREGDHVVIDNNPEAIRGWRVDQILTSDLFELPSARPPEYDQKIARRKELVANPSRSPVEQQELEQLDAEITALPTGQTDEEARRMMKLAEESQELLKKYGG